MDISLTNLQLRKNPCVWNLVISGVIDKKLVSKIIGGCLGGFYVFVLSQENLFETNYGKTPFYVSGAI